VISVFGASGFLGSEICNSLSSEGTRIDGVLRETSSPWRLENLAMLQQIHLGQHLWRDYLNENKPTAVVAANWSGVSKNQRQDLKIQHENLESVMELASYSKSAGVKKFIAFGSQGEVPNSSNPIDENLTEPQGDSYSQMKSKLGLKLHDYFENSHTQLIWVRPFSIYGPKDSNESLIPQMFQAAQSQSQFKISNPGLMWSALHVSDFGRAIKRIVKAENLEGVINVGNPNPVSIYEYAKAAEEELQKIFPTWEGCNLRPQPEREGKIPKVEKLRNLGWFPEFNLKSGVEDTINWLNANISRKPMNLDADEVK
jgi:nucleoside-diphosphate-sugar epimerase